MTMMPLTSCKLADLWRTSSAIDWNHWGSTLSTTTALLPISHNFISMYT
jgi:hypothetical protein